MIDKAKLDALKTKIRLDNLSKENNLEPIAFTRTVSPNKLMEDIKELRSLNILELEGKESSFGLQHMNDKQTDMNDGTEYSHPHPFQSLHPISIMQSTKHVTKRSSDLPDETFGLSN